MSKERKLSHAEKKQIEAAIAKAKNADKKERSAQDSITYQRMWPDGICRVTDTFYTKTIQYEDINYQLCRPEDQTAIFDGWCDFLNYFDSSIKVQLSFVNLAVSKNSSHDSVVISLQGDEFDHIRKEYSEMLQNRLLKGNNGIAKCKYLTFGIDADRLKDAKPRLERMEADVLNNFKRLGVTAFPLNGAERLKVFHDILRMEDPQPFHFSWDWLVPSGLSTKDFIAPGSFEFRSGKDFHMGEMMGSVSFLQILAPEIDDEMLSKFLDTESNAIVSMHIQPIDQVNALKMVKRKITDLDRSKIEEQKKAVRSGYDMDIIPSDLATYGEDAKKLLQELQSHNEKMFYLTFLIANFAKSKQKLKNNIAQMAAIAQQKNCPLVCLDFQQEDGLMSSLPLGLNLVEIQRGITTPAVAVFMPFTTQGWWSDPSSYQHLRRKSA